MDITLTPELQEFVDANVSNGRFGSPEELVLAALTAFVMNDRAFSSLSAEGLEAIYPGLREKIAEGIASADAGELVDGDEFFAELEREEEELARQAGRKSA